MRTWIYLIIGSILGGAARYVMAGRTYAALGASFPYGTLAVNLTGCFLIGGFDALANERFGLGPHARMFLMTAFCGAFTTFSTFVLETSNLMKDGEFWLASLNVGGSVVLGLLVFRLGGLAANLAGKP